MKVVALAADHLVVARVAAVQCHLPAVEGHHHLFQEVVLLDYLLVVEVPGHHGKWTESTNPKYSVDSHAVHHSPPRSHLCPINQERHNLAYMFISHDLKVIRAMSHDIIVILYLK